MVYVLYNNCYGGFRFSKELDEYILKRDNLDTKYIRSNKYRTDQDVCRLILEKGSKWASSDFSDIQMCEVPDIFLDWIDVHEYDGMESIDLDTARFISKHIREYIKNPTEEGFVNLHQTIEIADNAVVKDVKIPE